MAEFSFFRHDRYPGVNFRVDINPTEIGVDSHAKVLLFVEGDPQSRKLLIADVEAWTSRHHVQPVTSRSVLSCSSYQFNLKGWNVVADFIVTWIGVDNISDTIQGREFLERRILGEVRALTFAVEALTSQVSSLQELMRLSNLGAACSNP